ncbi:MAG: hypothetical protein NTX52_02005 [Planctomycetota bacterium]|nr:hypothetical protein [Planctomycetota bacterium]
MTTPTANTFIVDCPWCKAKVAAIENGQATKTSTDYETGGMYGQKLLVGVCPRCNSLLAGEAQQIGFENIDSEYDVWSDVVRVFPKPPKTFYSQRLPRIVKESLLEADRSLQANANIAACISREDAEDLQTFVYAIIEYIYDLTDRYNEFKERIARKAKKKK